MKSKPILFSASMVRAILDGTKTQTRRMVKFPKGFQDPPPDRLLYQSTVDGAFTFDYAQMSTATSPGKFIQLQCPYGQPGDILWVKETHLPKVSGIIYRADFDEIDAKGLGGMYGGWKPSIYCRREYSRIRLEIIGIRVERLQDITPDDCRAEGHPTRPNMPQDANDDAAHDWYMDLWININGKDSWDANPWVWVIEFRRIKP